MRPSRIQYPFSRFRHSDAEGIAYSYEPFHHFVRDRFQPGKFVSKIVGAFPTNRIREASLRAPGHIPIKRFKGTPDFRCAFRIQDF